MYFLCQAFMCHCTSKIYWNIDVLNFLVNYEIWINLNNINIGNINKNKINK